MNNNTMSLRIVIFSLLTILPGCMSLTCKPHNKGRSATKRRITSTTSLAVSKTDVEKETIAEQEKKFKIVTCMSTSCCRKRESLGLDSLSTFGAMYTRASASQVRVEEGPCVGSCKSGPCVAIEHDDFFGSVALEGMTADEFSSDAFLNIVTEEDADRVWSCVENAVKVMIEAEE